MVEIIVEWYQQEFEVKQKTAAETKKTKTKTKKTPGQGLSEELAKIKPQPD